MTERFYDSPRGRVYYWLERGDEGKPALVFLPGLACDHTMFEKQVEFFSGKGFTVLVWDAPCHGKSRPYEDFTYDNAAEDLCAILDSEGIEKPVLAGHFIGGYVCQAFLLRRPEGAKAFIAIDTAPYGLAYYSESDVWWNHRIQEMSRVYSLWALRRSLTKPVSSTAYGRALTKKALAGYGKDDLCNLMGVGYSGFINENRDLDIQCPVLILVGDADKTGKISQYSEAWHQQTGYRLVKIEGAAHLSPADNPDAVNAAIFNFITRS